MTITTSLTVSYLVNETPFGTVPMPLLRKFGGTTFEDIRHFEIWRIASAQLIHAKQAHMLFNAIFLLLLGGLVESRIGGRWTFSIWLIAGGVGTLVSPVFIEAPWDVGTGASQANAALAGSATVLVFAGTVGHRLVVPLIAIVLGITLILDLFTAGYPKPGHLAGLLLGMLFGGAYVIVDKLRRSRLQP